MKTVVAKQKNWNERGWYHIDAQGKTLGKVAVEIATLLKGKNKVDFTPHLDNGAYVVVTNCDKFHVTGNKMTDKLYRHHSGFLGGIKSATLKETLKKAPTKALELAVLGMLPKTKHRDNMMARMKLFTGAEHTYVAQQPQTVTL